MELNLHFLKKTRILLSFFSYNIYWLLIMEFHTILCINQYFLLFPKLTPEVFFLSLYSVTKPATLFVRGGAWANLVTLSPVAFRGSQEQSVLKNGATVSGLPSVQFSSVAQSCPTLCDPLNRSMQASLSITNSRSLPKPMSTEFVMPSSRLILSSPSPPALNLSQHQGLFK